jgi:predicted lipoprotein with Yx(FWY)xxD motif
MRKSGWAAAAGLGSLVLLLTACGGSSSSSSTTGTGSTATATSQATAAGQPTSNINLPSPGTTILIVQKSKLGYVLAEANGQVVYTYSGDKKGSVSTCTGSCATAWPAVTGNPQASSADTLPGTLGTVATANGAKQITYNGLPLYTFKGAKPLSVAGNGVGGMWHVIKMSKSDINGGA